MSIRHRAASPSSPIMRATSPFSLNNNRVMSPIPILSPHPISPLAASILSPHGTPPGGVLSPRVMSPATVVSRRATSPASPRPRAVSPYSNYILEPYYNPQRPAPARPRREDDPFDPYYAVLPPAKAEAENYVERVEPRSPVAKWRAWTLLIIFSTAQMLDVFNVTAPTIALPALSSDLDVNFSERQWAINAYSLTFGAFLLTGGRFSSMYGAKKLFVIGFTSVGICAIIDGFAINGPMLFVFRAFQGVGAAMTIPSALSMIATLFPGRGEQDMAFGVFGGFGAVGSVLGLVLGGVISQLLSWRWVFWIMACVILPLSLAAFILAPAPEPGSFGHQKLKDMDWIGLLTITLSLVLFIYSVTEGNVRGWTSGGILAPLIISILLLPVFGFIETRVKDPLIPPVVWTLPGFVPMFFITLCEYMTMNVIIYQESLVFQQVWRTSALSAAIRTIPFGITGFMTTVSMGFITPRVAPRWILSVGLILMVGGILLVAFAATSDRYWSMVMPAFVLTALGVASGFVAANIAMIRTPLARPSVRLHDATALIGSIFNADLQIGSTMGLAIATAVTLRVSGDDSSSDFAGYQASYWFLLGIVIVEVFLALIGLRGHEIPQEFENGEETIVALTPKDGSQTEPKNKEQVDSSA